MINFLRSNSIKLRIPRVIDKGYRYQKVPPIYPLPAGMTYNSIADWVDGTAIYTQYNPPTDTVVTITNQGSVAANTTALQSAINAAAARDTGTTIIVTAGLEFNNIFFRGRASTWTGWIYIISSQQDQLPPPGDPYQASIESRVTPLYASHMYRIITKLDNVPAIRADPEAHGYWISGAEIGVASGVYATSLISYSPTVQSDVQVDGRISEKATIDRCWVHGNYDNKIHGRGIFGMARDLSIINSYFNRIKGPGYECQCVLILCTDGAIKLDNNYFEATTENSMSGGGGSFPGWTPTNIQVTGNHYRKRPEWNEGGKYYDGINFSIKNLIEFKMGLQILIQGNVFENTWPDGQDHVMVLKATSQSGATPWITTQNITIRYNCFLNYWAFASLHGKPESEPVADEGGYYDLHNNLCIQAHDLDSLDPTNTRTSAHVISSGSNVHEFRLKNNTFIHNDGYNIWQFNEVAANDPLTVEDNIFVYGTNGGMEAGGGNEFNGGHPSINDGNANLQYFHPGSTFANNVLIVNGRNLPPANEAEYSSGSVVRKTLDEVFHSWRNLNPRIKDDTVRFAGSNGTTPGCNVDKVLEIYNAVRTDAYYG